MKISVLGTGCAKCTKLHDHARQAIEKLGLQAELVKVTDIQEIMAHGVMMTPALVVDGEVKIVGKVPSVAELETLLG
ncbi:thioredoxin family protein [bacterium]|nr:thioredoxin family protein [bacterium]